MSGVTLETRTGAAGKQVPFDEGAEQQVLGSLLIDRDAIFKVADLLRVDDFYIPRHQRIYDAAQALLERRERIDPLTIQMELSRREELDRAGGQAYLRALADGVPTAAEIDRYGHIVRDRAILRRLLGAATSIAADAYDEPTDIALALDRAEQRLFALRDESANAQLRHITASLQSNYEHLTDRMERPFEVSGIPSGFREVDYYTEGFTTGDLIVVAARPSVGKTSLALGMTFNIARRGHPVLLFSLEMDAKQIVSRFLALNSRMDLLALRTGNIIDTDAAAALHGLPILIDDTPGISIMELRTKARRASTHEKVDVIVVDYLQLVRTGGEDENRVQEIATITRNLKALARELDVVIIGLSQLSRAAGDAGGEPKLSTLREGGSLEQDSDLVVMLWRDREETPAGAPRLINGSIAKNRNGPTGIFQLLFESEQARFFVSLMQNVPTVAHAESYAAIVERTALLRRLIGSANEIARLALTRDEATSAVADAQELLFSLSESTLHRDIVPLDVALRRYAEQIDARGDLRVGIKTGFETLDKKTGGLQPSDLILIAGRPGLGKTSLALNVVEHAAVVEHKTCAMFSMEMSELQVVQRLVSMRAEIDGNRLRRGRLSGQEFTAISAASSVLQPAPIFIEESSRLTVTDVLAKSRRLQAERGLDLVVIDYLQLIEGAEDDESRVLEVARVSRALKAIARELEVPVIALSQLSRQIEQRGTEPMLSDLRESGALEADADLVLFLWQKDRKDREEGVVRLKLAKHRNGPTGDFDLHFQSELTRFRDLGETREGA